MSKIRTHYDNLKVARNAPDAVIRASYKALIQQWHPDKFEGAKKDEALRITKIIQESFNVLSDPTRRAIHDKSIEEQETAAQQFGNVSGRTDTNKVQDKISASSASQVSKPPKALCEKELP